jgi:hypothetical protein
VSRAWATIPVPQLQVQSGFPLPGPFGWCLPFSLRHSCRFEPLKPEVRDADRPEPDGHEQVLDEDTGYQNSLQCLDADQGRCGDDGRRHGRALDRQSPADEGSVD